MAPVQRFEKSEVFPATVAFLWDLLSNTEHLNRTVGLPSVQYSPLVEDERGIYRPARASFGPIRMEWREFPFEWVKPDRYLAYREFTKGPFLWVRGGVEIREGEKNSTVLTIVSEIASKGALGTFLSKRIAGNGARDVVKYVHTALDMAQHHADAVPRDRTRSATRTDLLDERFKRVTFTEGELANRIRSMLLDGTDEEVLSILPHSFAAPPRLEAASVVRQLLPLVRESILSLEWKVLCPNCRVPKAGARSLGEVPSQVHCDFCGINYATDLEKAIEMRFRIHPSLRDAKENTYCIGGPANTPHILAQAFLKPDEEKDIRLEPGDLKLRIRTLRTNESCLWPSGDNATVTFDGTKWSSASEGVAAGIVRIKNASNRSIVAAIEDPILGRGAFTLADALSLQDFRDMFSRELLSPGVSVSVETVAILFTDLTDSTVMYEDTGDAGAYVSVRKHFDLLKQIIARNHGAIVKTIGDAVMASFQRESDCVKAVLEICKQAPEFAQILPRQGAKAVKAGMHSGPAILVNANERMDYFGRTVNIAARIQGESKGGDAVLPLQVFENPENAAAFREFSFQATEFEATLKGIENRWRLVRIKF